MRRQALASIRKKDFHVYGGCVLATFLERGAALHYVRLVAAYETAVDYLDNLCDRAGTADAADHAELHAALADAVSPGARIRSYFRYRASDDGGYLSCLVREAQKAFGELPAFDAIREPLADNARRYCDLQVRKHLSPGLRESACAEAFSAVDPRLRWWEGAAASGSTMPAFALAFAAFDPLFDAAAAQRLYQAYFPALSAFHILLDYFVDRREDRRHRELNFVDCYPSTADARASMLRIEESAIARLSELPHSEPHLFAMRAMCAYYCTRRLAKDNDGRSTARALMAGAGLLGQDGWRAASVRSLLGIYAKAIRT